MKFLITWKVHEDKRHEALKTFSAMSDQDDSKDLGGVRLIGRWHELIGFTGAAIAETDDPQALSNWLLNWNGVIDVRSVPVLDDNEARELGRQREAWAKPPATGSGRRPPAGCRRRPERAPGTSSVRAEIAADTPGSTETIRPKSARAT